MSNPTKAEKEHWDKLANEVGCIACRVDGNFNNYVSIHHIDGRTKPGANMNVIPLCSGHHQQGTGNDKTMIAVHPNKARFEERYLTQQQLKLLCNDILIHNQIFK